MWEPTRYYSTLLSHSQGCYVANLDGQGQIDRTIDSIPRSTRYLPYGHSDSSCCSGNIGQVTRLLYQSCVIRVLEPEVLSSCIAEPLLSVLLGVFEDRAI